MEELENVKKQITEMVEQKWIESEDESYNILFSLLKSNPENMLRFSTSLNCMKGFAALTGGLDR